MDISYYNSEGRITGKVSGDAAAIEMVAANTTKLFVEGDYFGKPFYVLNGEVTPRPEMSVVLTGNVLTGLPVPCRIAVNQMIYDCNEDTATLSFNFPGTYKIVISSWPYLDKEFTHVNPA